MWHNDHSPPHFHVYYSGNEGQVTLGSIELMRGRLPARVLALVREWAEVHSLELQEDWNLARDGKPLKPIAPLE